MTTLLQIVRRHEETMRGEDGTKLDKPTTEGIASAYEKGHKLRLEYPDYVLRAYHSATQRTYACAAAWLLGADARTMEVPSLEEQLNNFETTPEIRKQIRKMKDEMEQYDLLLTKFIDPMKEAGKRIAKYIVRKLCAYREQGQKAPMIDINLTHGPAIDAAYLTLLNLDVNFRNVISFLGIINAGEGFDVQLKEDEGKYKVEITAKDKRNSFLLDDLKKNLSV